jgi:hypothetical protein
MTGTPTVVKAGQRRHFHFVPIFKSGDRERVSDYLAALPPAPRVAFLQIPFAVAFDRWSTRVPMAAMMSAGALGSAIVAISTDFLWALTGQTLIGVGCAPVFMGALYHLGKAHDAEGANFRSKGDAKARGNKGYILFDWIGDLRRRSWPLPMATSSF